MSKQQAIAAMKKGSKVTHITFTDNKWMSLRYGKMLTEDGCLFDFDIFWSNRLGELWQDGYSVIK